MNEYVCFWENQSIEVHAVTLAEARAKAVVRFKVRVRKAHEIHVMLAVKDGKPVIHTAS